jgi:hypothetical protein
VAVEGALFSSSPKRRYLVIPRHFHDRLNSHTYEDTIRWQIQQLVQLNEGQPYTYDRETLIKIDARWGVGQLPAAYQLNRWAVLQRMEKECLRIAGE